MKKQTKKDIFYCTLLVLTFLVLVFKLVGKDFYFGSDLDWYSQHISIPEYFRTLFYDTKDLLPDFAPNIGNGQNIYNFSYYGLLSPNILLSYLFPHISMINYMIISTIITSLISSILIYIFLKNKNYNSEICFISSIIFLLSAPISFHTHRHIMFINYMPYLILSLMGAEKLFKHNKSYLLIIGTFLMIMTNYYFSIGGIICIIVYYMYLYLAKNDTITFKTFFNTMFRLALPLFIAVLSSSIITFPTLATMFNNRLDSNVNISLKDLLFNNNTKNLLYDSYGLGLTAIAVPAIINFYHKNKSNLFLAGTLSCLVVFNIFNYLLNGTMYIDSKSLIPFLPLYILLIAHLLKDILDKKINYKIVIPILIIISIYISLNEKIGLRYLLEITIFLISIIIYSKFKNKYVILIPIFLIVLTNTYYLNRSDELEEKDYIKYDEKLITSSLKDITSNDKDLYRTSIDINRTKYPNKIFNNIDYYNSTIYSSISNSSYNTFYYDTLFNNMQARNRALTVTTSNIFSLLLSGNKYIITDKDPLYGYELINKEDELNIYRNEDSLPIGFATSNIMSYKDFNNLTLQEQQEALLNVIVAETDSSNNFISHIEKSSIDIKNFLIQENKAILKEDSSIDIEVNDRFEVTIPIPKEEQNKILLISFDMNKESDTEDLVIRINDIQNKLTISDWKYHNGNTRFDYVLAFQNQKELKIKFYEGEYNLSNFEIYTLDYTYIESSIRNMDKLNVTNHKGDTLEGNINVSNNGYFIVTVPYDKGYTIKVDNKEVEYSKVDNAFIGIPISKGEHTIKIEYNAPFKKFSIITSLIGIISFIILTILEKKKILFK